ncbi:NADH dehydrogenase [ubiquinone] 1 alpha subcomplex subunit 9, mitochondrial [Venturia canescens]|uniref:NADH dehydrogenase [ubiquinone] 1 alpha subcomplex subunit 9, mitochondrial n=1 Tax=Venturia canescens TaxID=32260 RepID=UPI001C9BF7E6|nr:NADH dehydrogenase [ubiquinone] 1 alpha subcomplex subunit 9, mitochondrial [Venturia canescens]
MAVVARASVVSTNCLRATQRLESKNGGSFSVVLFSTNNRKYSSNPSPHVIEAPSTVSLKRGTGGRSSFNGITCTVFGATGFLGTYVCNRLGKIGTQMILPHRCDPYYTLRLKLCGDLGQVLFHPFHLRDEDSIMECIKYSNVVINMIGCEWETRNFSYHDVNVEGARRLARLCKKANVPRFVHLSCLNANPKPKPIMLKNGSGYLKSKWEGECAVREEFPEATIIRPADIYGQEDRSFINVYCDAWRRHFRGIPLWNKGETTEKQPIWAGDVAAGIAAVVKDPKTAGQIYQFVGPKRYQLSELIDWIARMQRRESVEWGHRRLELKHTPLFHFKIFVTQACRTKAPFASLHWECLESAHTSDVVVKGIPTLEDLGIQPTAMESRMPWEVRARKSEAHYMEQLGEFDEPALPKTIPLMQ